MPADPGRIEVVATPIGNLGDLSPRAREALAAADVIAAEDTRHSGALLKALGIERPMVSLHGNNEAQRIPALLARLANGERIALVSDAGTPLISDPGYALVRAALDGGFDVRAVPGPNAALVALACSGLPADRFCFEGFLPARAAARSERLRALARESRTLIFYEAPHRVAETLEDMAREFGPERHAVAARELSKLHESIYRGTLSRLQQIAREDANFRRGELTLVVAGAPQAAAADDAFVARAMQLLSAELPPSRAAAVVAQLTGRRRAEVYALAPGHAEGESGEQRDVRP